MPSLSKPCRRQQGRALLGAQPSRARRLRPLSAKLGLPLDVHRDFELVAPLPTSGLDELLDDGDLQRELLGPYAQGVEQLELGPAQPGAGLGKRAAPSSVSFNSNKAFSAA